jgi:hypothetical protein
MKRLLMLWNRLFPTRQRLARIDQNLNRIANMLYNKL